MGSFASVQVLEVPRPLCPPSPQKRHGLKISEIGRLFVNNGRKCKPVIDRPHKPSIVYMSKEKKKAFGLKNLPLPPKKGGAVAQVPIKDRLQVSISVYSF